MTVVNEKLIELNEKILHFNPLLDTWQNTPRGGVFLSDESGELLKLETTAANELELAYLYKRGAKLSDALKIFKKWDVDQSLIQQAFIYRALRNPELLFEISLKIQDATWKHFFHSEVSRMRGDIGQQKIDLHKSLEANPKNIHALQSLIEIQDSEIELEYVVQRWNSMESASIQSSIAMKMFKFGNFRNSLQFSRLALNSGLLQTSTFLTLLESMRVEKSTKDLAQILDVGSERAISELRAAIGLCEIVNTSKQYSEDFYNPNKVIVLKVAELAAMQLEAFELFKGDMIHDSDASDYNGRFFSLDVTTHPAFENYFVKLKQIYNQQFKDSPELLDYDYIWSDVSVTTNSTKINNHLHTAGLNREYFYTAVTYPMVPEGISDASNAGYLRVGPPIIPGFEFKTWTLEIKPTTETVVLFPSNYYHESIALPNQKTKRVSINTDFAKFSKGNFSY